LIYPITPTQNLNAEMQVLGSMLLSDLAAQEVAQILSVEDFSLHGHRIIFKLFKDLLKAGKPLDFPIIEDALMGSGLMADAGGENYLIEIAEEVSSPVNAAYYAGAVREHAVRRALDQARNKIGNMVSDSASPDEFAKYLSELHAITATAGKSPMENIGDIEFDDDEPDGTPTGWKSLDDATGTNGCASGQFTMICAKPGRGKSTAMECLLLNEAKRLDKHPCGKRVLYAAWTDIDRKEFMRRLLKIQTGWRYRPKINMHLAQEWDDALDYLRYLPIQWLDVSQTGSLNLENFFAFVNQESKKMPYSIMCMDYAQAFETSERANGMFEKQSICSRIVAKNLRRLGNHAYIGSQLNADGRTSMSKQWENDFAMQLMIQDEGFMVEKARHSQARGSVLPIQFNKEFGRFEDMG